MTTGVRPRVEGSPRELRGLSLHAQQPDARQRTRQPGRFAPRRPDMKCASPITAPWRPFAGCFPRRCRGASGRSPRNSSSPTGVFPGWRNSGSFGRARNWSGIRQREIRAIAAEAANEAVRFGADYVGLKLWNGDGFSGSVRIAEAVRARAPRVRPHRRRPACRLLRRAYPPIHRRVRPVDPGRGRARPSGIDRRAGAQGRLAEDPGRGVEAREPDFLQPDLRRRGARRAAASGL